MSEATPPVFHESLGGSVIDAARISVLAAMHLIPEGRPPTAIVLPGIAQDPTIHECLTQAMAWLDQARELAIVRMVEPITSLHVVGGSHG